MQHRVVLCTSAAAETRMGHPKSKEAYTIYSTRTFKFGKILHGPPRRKKVRLAAKNNGCKANNSFPPLVVHKRQKIMQQRRWDSKNKHSFLLKKTIVLALILLLPMSVKLQFKIIKAIFFFSSDHHPRPFSLFGFNPEGKWKKCV